MLDLPMQVGISSEALSTLVRVLPDLVLVFLVGEDLIVATIVVMDNSKVPMLTMRGVPVTMLESIIVDPPLVTNAKQVIVLGVCLQRIERGCSKTGRIVVIDTRHEDVETMHNVRVLILIKVRDNSNGVRGDVTSKLVMQVQVERRVGG